VIDSPGTRGANFDFSPWTELPPLAAEIGDGPTLSRPGELERLVALAALVFASPFFALIAMAIKIDSPRGPIYYRQQRVGVDRRRGGTLPAVHAFTGDRERRRTRGSGQQFRIWKFRTMIPDAEVGTGPVWASDHDPRVTRVGRVLRHMRLDELPQLINVVQGHMRLIGPRPERPEFVESFAATVPDYPRRHAVPPGITGLAQVEREYDADLDDVRTKLKYDLFYVDNRSWLMDVKILLKTVDVVVRGRGAR
jgi:lipopolysaccharide/colanic/teichoic acid biosynthesis glycosyltransferase